MYYWTAKNNNSFLNGYRTAKTLRGAVMAARKYVINELYGEGKIYIYDREPGTGYEPIRKDEKFIFTGNRWMVIER